MAAWVAGQGSSDTDGTERWRKSLVDQNRRYFREHAAAYDRGREAFYAHDGARMLTDFAALLAGRNLAEVTALDIGCGTGFCSLVLGAAGVRRFRCLDLNEVFLALAKGKLTTRYADAEVTCHMDDLASFLQRGADLEEVDVVVMGSVLQYVPEPAAVLRELVSRCPARVYYITSTRLPRGQVHERLERTMAAADYLLHRLWHGGSDKARAPQQQATTEVDHREVERVFAEGGLQTRLYRYTTFHTALFNAVHRVLRGLLPTAGACFTLIAVRPDARHFGTAQP